jgi:hypothetical protein
VTGTTATPPRSNRETMRAIVAPRQLEGPAVRKRSQHGVVDGPMERDGGRTVDHEGRHRQSSELRRIVVVVANRVKCAQRVTVLHPLAPVRCLSRRAPAGTVPEQAPEPLDVSLGDRNATERAQELLHRTRARIVVPMVRQHPERRRLDQRERAHAVRTAEREDQRRDATMRHPDQVRFLHAEAVKGYPQRRHFGHERIVRRERPVLEPVLNREALHIYDGTGPRKHLRHAAPPVGAEESTSQENHRAAAPENPGLGT